MSPTPWAPMAEPPLPLPNDRIFNTCEHAYPAEDCATISIEHYWQLPLKADGSHLKQGAHIRHCPACGKSHQLTTTSTMQAHKHIEQCSTTNTKTHEPKTQATEGVAGGLLP